MGSTQTPKPDVPPARADHKRLTRRTFLALVGATVAALFAIRIRDERAIAPAASPTNQSASPTPAPVISEPPTVQRRPGLWLSPEEIVRLETDSPAFDRLRDRAERRLELEDVSDQDAELPLHCMATALVAARLDDDALRGRVRDVLLDIIGTEDGSTGRHDARNRPLGIGRNLPGFVISADLIHLGAFDADADRRFRTWLDVLRTKRVRDADMTLKSAETTDHSNWGAHMSAALTAANLYLEDEPAVEASAHALRGWLGDRTGSQEWVYDTDRHDYSWQCHFPDVDRYLPVNPVGCERDGMSLDGIIPIDMQRGRGFRIPPRKTRYPRESLQGRSVQAEMLWRAGYEVWEWADRALLRIAQRLLAMSTEFDEDWYEPDMGCYWILSTHYPDARLPLEAPSIGRSVSGVDWTHTRPAAGSG